ncbi:MAG: lysophospholipid acyltransferase family protein [Chloroflexi bacterium]|nr:lysophospholipid acyltransferase family protein [Chloroflexota bacterium]
MAQKLFRIFVRFVLFFIARVDITGYENLPPQGGYILAANHLGRLDSALLYYAVQREDIIMPVAEKYKTHWLFGPLVIALGGFFINRFDADLQAIREVLKRLKKGGVFVIAPEGTRSKVEALQEARPGAAFFASRSGLPIIPIALTGTEDRAVVDNLKHFRRSHITVQAGAPFTLANIKRQQNDEALAGGTDEIMCRIGVMLPEKYRGFYAEHARLKELLAGQARQRSAD